jgi:hypothetical protein
MMVYLRILFQVLVLYNIDLEVLMAALNIIFEQQLWISYHCFKGTLAADVHE